MTDALHRADASPDALTATGITHRYPPRRDPAARRIARTARASGAPGPAPALDDVTFRVAPGETVGIVGRSGSGKSTLLRVLLALEAPTAGTVALGDRAVAPGRASALRWYRRRVQAVPQDPGASLEPRMTVRQLIREPLRRLDVPGDHAAIVARALDDVGLAASLADRRPRELSGGQAQRVALARAIATSPGILLADEPVSRVDLPLRDRIIELLGGLVRERGLGLVLVSHDLDAIARLCGRSVVMAGGRIVEEGPTACLLADPVHPATRELADAVPRLPGALTA
ncbi:ABC transporter ATP-binding protein [Clavibacter michiganensis]|uniref:ABC transporter permease n=3 Tax=Clavibacter michiganensis TaxID=28447 RepID=A0A0D5CJ70_9MICO|nr:ABC transporter ATP-binding protein [Clavibacter michiganensis]AJW79666.1 ABC transporter permease [Clavibacter michiganensis subsp. insidiosus]AWF97551.1 ABC transporter permease [Clavibacter michiganensis subsp. insidiosus]AWG00730.1 ABC transporter permease [Clavibacter michiganensis subsp. insidiosus]OQJ60674.1 ABC transporter ATP-binding protein [Clavibacter michiganensis subsp. insidiosus]RMC84819.1 ABC transporter ATP-binding protein [Clavibacter michiganensis subsp. insidiosus]